MQILISLLDQKSLNKLKGDSKFFNGSRKAVMINQSTYDLSSVD